MPVTNNVYIIDHFGNPSVPTIVDTGGIDRLEYDASFAAYSEIYLAGLTSTVESSTPTSFAWTQYSNSLFSGSGLKITGIVENAKGGNGADKIVGNEFGNVLFGDKATVGLGGNDSIFGLNGNDLIHGGNGNDSIEGGAGSDTIYGGAGNDHIYGDSSTPSTRNKDKIEGGAGADTLQGGYDGDTVSYYHSATGVRITLDYNTVTTGAGGDAQGDRIDGIANAEGSQFADVLTANFTGSVVYSPAYVANVLSGLGGNDTLNGGAGDDYLVGGSGNDSLIGGTGADRLTGGTGADRFVFLTRGHSLPVASLRDTITDFHRSEGDRIDLRGIDANIATAAVNDAFHFVGAAPLGTAGSLRIVDTGVDMLVYGDVNGDHAADFSILVKNVATLGAGDFLL